MRPDSTIASAAADRPGPDQVLREAREKIRRLRSLSRRGYYGLALFILLTVIAIAHFRWLPSFALKIVAAMGPPPPVKFINIALVIYTFSAIILILSRMMQGANSYHGWSHLFYLASFYAFYYVASALDENFWAVFASGLTILVLENFRVTLHCSEAIRREEETVARILRTLGRSQGT